MEFQEENRKVKIRTNCFIADHEKMRIEITGRETSKNTIWVCVIKNSGEPFNRRVRGKQIDFLDFGNMLYKYLGKRLKETDKPRRKKIANKT